MKRCLLIFITLLLAVFGMVGCKNDSTPVLTVSTPPATDNEELSAPTMRVRVSHMVIGEDQAYFQGTTELFDATLRSQLYQDGKPLDWWPADQDIKTDGYRWEITVPLPEELPVKSLYALKIWDKDDPSRYGGHYFDLQGPPSMTTEQ